MHDDLSFGQQTTMQLEQEIGSAEQLDTRDTVAEQLDTQDTVADSDQDDGDVPVVTRSGRIVRPKIRMDL